MHAMTSPVSPRRTRRRDRTRQELLTAARALIAEKGVADLRVSLHDNSGLCAINARLP